MSTAANFSDLVLDPADNQRLANLCGQFDEHLRQIERRLGVEINNRGNAFRIIGEQRSVAAAAEILKLLYDETANQTLKPEFVHLSLQESGVDALLDDVADTHKEVIIKTRHGTVRARGPHQSSYMRNIMELDVCFGVGPAGTGKTY